MKTNHIGLFGYGCVGQGFYEILNNNTQLKASVKKICVKDSQKLRPSLEADFVYDHDEILNDPDIDIVVELIDDAEAAYDIVKNAFEKGKHVVSANKKMIATHLDQLNALSRSQQRHFMYEGAVGGSIPILSCMSSYYNYDRLLEINGILNGSTNYILTKICEENLNYAEALKHAAQNGFAESDPTLDVAGYDAAFKLSLLIARGFGITVKPNDVFTAGIEQITPADVAFAQSHQLKIKLIAHASLQNGELTAWVAPQFVTSASPFYLINDEYNAVKLTSSALDEQVLTGKGAGKLPTGLAVFSDVAAICNKTVAGPESTSTLATNHGEVIEVYLGYSSGVLVDWSLFEEISEKQVNKIRSYAIGTIRLDKLKYIQSTSPNVSIIFTSGKQVENHIKSQTYSYGQRLRADTA
ncbi:MAG: homoserine dehydrogenase [Fulvivirga sp.]|nr:homoserine dehydrogenase [Fulvivirga sp.]